MRLADMAFPTWNSEPSTDLLSNAELKTAYDKLGRPSHLVAYVSNSVFQGMYGSRAWSSVFIAGLWFLFCRTPSGYQVTCKTTGSIYECVFACAAFGTPSVSFFRNTRKIATSHVRGLSLDELEWDDHGVRWLSKKLVRMVEQDLGQGLRAWVRDNSHPSIHILPERALPKDFRAAAVLLQ